MLQSRFNTQVEFKSLTEINKDAVLQQATLTRQEPWASSNLFDAN